MVPGTIPTIIACILGLFSAFGITFALVRPSETPPTEETNITKVELSDYSTSDDEEWDYYEEPQDPVVVSKPSENKDKVTTAKSEQAPTRDSVFRKQISLPNSSENDKRIYNLIVHHSGKYAVVISKASIRSIDFNTGKELAKQELENIHDYAYPSPDGRFVALIGQEEIKIFDTERYIQRAYFQRDRSEVYPNGKGCFSRNGDYFYFTTYYGLSGVTLHELDTSRGFHRDRKLGDVKLDGVDAKIDTPRRFLGNYYELEVIPDSSRLFLGQYDSADKTSYLTYDTKTETLTAINGMSGLVKTNFHTRGLEASPHGRYLSSVTGYSMAVYDRWKKKLSIQVKNDDTYNFPCFTPDGQRLIVRNQHEPVVWTVGHYPPAEIALYDCESGRKMTKFIPFPNKPKNPTTAVMMMDMGHDGTYFVLCSANKLHICDFQKAFGVAPLPPLKREPDRSVLD